MACSIGQRSSSAADSGVRITPPNDSPVDENDSATGRRAGSNQRVINVVAGSTEMPV